MLLEPSSELIFRRPFWSLYSCWLLSMYVCMLVFKTPHRQKGFGNIHTYIRSWRLPGKVKNARNPHRERGLGSDQRELCCRWNAKTLTGRGVSKRTRNESSWLLSMYVCMFGNIHTYMHQYVSQGQKPSQGEGFWVSIAKTLHRERVLGTYIHTCLELSDIHTYMLGGPCLNRPPEAQKIKFRPGSPECFKTLTETKVWTHFLVQAGYLDFWASEASDAEQHSCMYVCMYVWNR